MLTATVRMISAIIGQPIEIAIGPPLFHAHVEEREAAGEDRDDRERDREVREPRPAAVELLLVAEFGEALLVAVGWVGSGPSVSPPPRPAVQREKVWPTDLWTSATLNPRRGRESSPCTTSWAGSSSSSRRAWASPRASREPLEGGITNRNYRARFGGTDYVIRVPGKDTSLLEIDRGAERIANERAARIGIAPPVAAMLDDPQAIVTVFVEGEGMEPERAARAGDARPRSRARCARSTSSASRCRPSFDSFRIVETYAETARERGAELPGRLRRGARARAARSRRR